MNPNSGLYVHSLEGEWQVVCNDCAIDVSDKSRKQVADLARNHARMYQHEAVVLSVGQGMVYDGRVKDQP